MTRETPTRIASFRQRERISLEEWAAEAKLNPHQLARYLQGTREPRSGILGRLVRAARKITGHSVKASDLYDLGEDEPTRKMPRKRSWQRHGASRTYETRFDQYLHRHGIGAAALARSSGIARQVISRKRSGAELPSTKIIAKLVRGLRNMGYDVRASDLFDVGEDVDFNALHRRPRS